MTDTVSPEKRSEIMRAVKGTDTTPEIAVRRASHAMGLRFRLRRNDLPGRPDLVFPSRRIALFVHGCFWHGHDCRRGARTPAVNADYWRAKIGRNRERDLSSARRLAELDWNAVVIWECETRQPARLSAILRMRVADVSCQQLDAQGGREHLDTVQGYREAPCSIPPPKD
jgi:DNA mismatch endonuclease (patch repair protein)